MDITKNPYHSVPVLPKKKPSVGDDRTPPGSAQKIKDRELAPIHAQHARQWPGDNSHSSDEARDEDCRRTVALKQILAASDCCRANVQSSSITLQQAQAAVNADGESEVVAQ